MKLTRPELDELLVDYLYDELDGARRAAFEQGLAEHPELVAEVEAHQRTRSAAAELPWVALPAGVLDDVLAEAARVASAQQAGQRADHAPGYFERLFRVFSQPAFAMATVAALVVGVGILFLDRPIHDDADPGRQRLAPRVVMAEGEAPKATMAEGDLDHAPAADTAEIALEDEVGEVALAQSTLGDDVAKTEAEEARVETNDRGEAATAGLKALGARSNGASGGAAAVGQRPGSEPVATGARRTPPAERRGEPPAARPATADRRTVAGPRRSARPADGLREAGAADLFNGDAASPDPEGAPAPPASGGRAVGWAPAPAPTPATPSTERGYVSRGAGPSAPPPPSAPAPAETERVEQERRVHGDQDDAREAYTREEERRAAERVANLWKRYEALVAAERWSDAEEVLDELAKIAGQTERLRTTRTSLARRRAEAERRPPAKEGVNSPASQPTY